MVRFLVRKTGQDPAAVSRILRELERSNRLVLASSARQLTKEQQRIEKQRLTPAEAAKAVERRKRKKRPPPKSIRPGTHKAELIDVLYQSGLKLTSQELTSRVVRKEHDPSLYESVLRRVSELKTLGFLEASGFSTVNDRGATLERLQLSDKGRKAAEVLKAWSE